MFLHHLRDVCEQICEFFYGISQFYSFRTDVLNLILNFFNTVHPFLFFRVEVANKITEHRSNSHLNMKGLHLLQYISLILPLNDALDVSHHFLPHPGCLISQLLKMLLLESFTCFSSKLDFGFSTISSNETILRSFRSGI